MSCHPTHHTGNGSHQTPGAILNFEVSWFPFALRRYCREADKERETFERVELCS